MPELRAPRRLNGGEKSGPGARVKADSRASGGAPAPALRRATGSDKIKTSNSSLTPKTVAQKCSRCHCRSFSRTF
jgi:hypothetical protein